MSIQSSLSSLLKVTLTSLFTLVALPSMAADSSSNDNVLNIYNWSNYIAPDTIANFEKQTGIKVRYDTYDNNEILNAKLMAGHTGYDIVVPSEGFANLQIKGRLLHPIDISKIPNYTNLDPTLLEKLNGIDPGNKYLVPWLWGYRTIAINRELVKQYLGDTPMPKNSWDFLFNPKYASKLSKCGIDLFDTAAAVMPTALLYIHKSPTSTNPADYAAAVAMMRKIYPYISKIVSGGYIDDLVSQNACLVMGPSGDLNIAKYQVEKMKKKFQIDVLMPNDISILFFDSMAIPKDAPHISNAYKFINYILQPKVAASLTNAVFYPNPTKDSRKYVQKRIADNETIFVPKPVLEKIHPPIPLDEILRRLETRSFAEFKSGI